MSPGNPVLNKIPLALLLCAVLLAACTPAGNPTAEVPVDMTAANQTSAVRLTQGGAAPELQNEIWLNTEEPLDLQELRGQVVLLDFWTFG